MQPFLVAQKATIQLTHTAQQKPAPLLGTQGMGSSGRESSLSGDHHAEHCFRAMGHDPLLNNECAHARFPAHGLLRTVPAHSLLLAFLLTSICIISLPYTRIFSPY